jgi:DNA-binding GntR family transcriptional regulator
MILSVSDIRKGKMPAKPEPMADATARQRGRGSQIVYEELRKSILELTLPPASPLDEASLSEEFGMSRTPIREALVRLAGEGLVTTLPNRNTIVAPIDFISIPVYFEALTLMYRVTTRSAAVHHKPEHLVAIRGHQSDFADAVARRDALAMIAANREFHVAIAEAGGNSYFTSFFARLLDEGRRVLRLYYSSFDDRLPRQYVQEHERIIAAIEARDAELSDRLSTEHAVQIVTQIQTYLSRNTLAGIGLSLTREEV